MDAPKELGPTSGRGWGKFGFVVGIVTSIAANVARTFVPPHNAPADWSPHPGAIVAAGFWPLALLISLEIISRVQWPGGIGWLAIRYGGLTAVAAIAAIISYRHMSGLLHAHGEDGVSATMGPLAVDGLMVVSSGALLAVARNVGQARADASGESAQLAGAALPPRRAWSPVWTSRCSWRPSRTPPKTARCPGRRWPGSWRRGAWTLANGTPAACWRCSGREAATTAIGRASWPTNRPRE